MATSSVYGRYGTLWKHLQHVFIILSFKCYSVFINPIAETLTFMCHSCSVHIVIMPLQKYECYDSGKGFILLGHDSGTQMNDNALGPLVF